MKSLIRKQNYVVSTFLTILVLFCTFLIGFSEAEARTVKLFYLLPNDRAYDQTVVDDMKSGILSVQSFYADQMEAHGYGRLTFSIETDGNGNPVVHRVDGVHPASFYESTGRPASEIIGAFDTSSIVQLVVLDISRSSGGRGEGLTSLSSLHLNVSTDNPFGNLITGNWFNLAPEITALKPGDFDGMPNLESLHLSGTELSSLSGNIFDKASMSLLLNNNKLSSLSDIPVLEDLTVLRPLYLANNPISDYGPLRRLIAAIEADGRTLSLDITIPEENPSTNNAPEFADGTATTRSVAKNTASGQNIGSAVSATDADNDTLTYSLGGTDAASFSINTSTGQLQTKAALDYEEKNSYTVTVSVSDGRGGSDSITVTINVTDVDETDLSNAITFAYKDSTATRIGATNIFRVTIIGTITASQSVRGVGTVEGYVNDDSIGIAVVNEDISAGNSVDVSFTGTWEHDGSSSQTVSIELK